jgi:hypothetical protein
MKNKDILVFLLCLLILLFVLNYVFKFSGIGNKTFEGFEEKLDCTELTKLIEGKWIDNSSNPPDILTLITTSNECSGTIKTTNPNGYSDIDTFNIKDNTINVSGKNLPVEIKAAYLKLTINNNQIELSLWTKTEMLGEYENPKIWEKLTAAPTTTTAAPTTTTQPPAAPAAARRRREEPSPPPTTTTQPPTTTTIPPTPAPTTTTPFTSTATTTQPPAPTTITPFTSTAAPTPASTTTTLFTSTAAPTPPPTTTTQPPTQPPTSTQASSTIPENINIAKLIEQIRKSVKNNNTTPSPFTTTPSPLTNDQKLSVKESLQHLPINTTLQILLNVLKEKQKNPRCNITNDQISGITDIIIDSPTNNINTSEELIEQLQDIVSKNYNVRNFTQKELKYFSNLNTDNLWETLLNLSIPRLKNNSKYSTQYDSGWSYVPPALWETNRYKTPICINSKRVSGPAFVFGDGVPANALELKENDNIGTPGASGIGSMMPKFSYREYTDCDTEGGNEYGKEGTEDSDDWSDGGLTAKDFDADGFSLSNYRKKNALDIEVHNSQARKRLQEDRAKNLKKNFKKKVTESLQKMLKTKGNLF